MQPIMMRFILGITLLTLFSCALEQTKPTPEKQPVENQEAQQPPVPDYIQLASHEAEIIGQRIWLNEGSTQLENLTAWNEGENFASLGIGHFIWYPAGVEGPFKESFPKFIAFLQEKNVRMPSWLQNTPDAPWSSLEEFKKFEKSPKVSELRNWLRSTIPLQVQFMIKRLEEALPKMLETLSTQAQRDHVFEQFYRIARSPNGLYALVDYVNFKGEGTSRRERYRGQGWGLLQVLENMSGHQSSDALAEFAQSALSTLKRRVQNSPSERQENRWLEGWINRVKTYTYKF